MAKVKVKGFKELRNLVGRRAKIAINKTIRDKTLRDKIGVLIVDYIRNNFSEVPAPATIAIRQYLEQFNTTHPTYKRRKINVTFSGALLDDLKNNVKADTTQLAIVIEHSQKKHPGYKTGSGKTKRVSFSLINQYLVNDMNYDYIKVDDKTKDKIVKLIRKEILNSIAA
jgi:hypothetical protein